MLNKQVTDALKWFAALVIALFVCGWLVTSLSATFNPQQEAIRRKTFEQSKAHRSGNAQELSTYLLEYNKATAEHKVAIKSVVNHQFADVDESSLPTHLQTFLKECRGN